MSKRRLQDQLVKKKKTLKYHWLTTVNSQSLLSTLDHLDKAFSAFFRGSSKYPNFKSKRASWQSFQNPQHVQADFESSMVKLPKIGRVKAVFHRTFEGRIKTCTVKKAPSGAFTLSMLIDDSTQLPSKSIVEPELTLGIDVGIKTFAVCSDETEFENPRFLNSVLVKLKQQQRILSRKKKGSANRSKQVRHVAVLHERTANARNNYSHLISHKLAVENQATSLVVEDLNIKGLIRNRKLSRHIADVAWGSFLQQLAYKCDWYGKNLITIGRFVPSSKTCSNCGGYKSDLKLSDRMYECAECKTVIDRDYNAAINIKNFGLKQELETFGANGTVKCSSKPISTQLDGLAKGVSIYLHRSVEVPTKTALAV